VEIFLRRILNNSENESGFTIVELLVVFGVIMLLTTGFIFYNRASERQLILFKEQVKIVGVLNKVKSLAIATYGETTVPCGYGVHFEAPNKIIIFKEIPAQADDLACLSVDGVYTAANLAEKQEEILLDKTIKFKELQLRDILFIPPNPLVIIDADFSKIEALIKIETLNGESERIIKVINSGQITIQ